MRNGVGTVKCCFHFYKYFLLCFCSRRELGAGPCLGPHHRCLADRKVGVTRSLKASCTAGKLSRRSSSSVDVVTASLNQVWASKSREKPHNLKLPAAKSPFVAQETTAPKAVKGRFIKSCCWGTQFLTSNPWNTGEVGSSHALQKASLHAFLSFPIRIPHAWLFIPSAHSSQIVCRSDRWKIHSVLRMFKHSKQEWKRLLGSQLSSCSPARSL